MKVHEVVRSAGPVIGFLPERCRVHPGDIVVLKSKRGSRRFIMTRNMSTAHHCNGSCSISRNTCRHYEFICPYYCYLKPIDDVLEEL
jgi:hypothetical protein